MEVQLVASRIEQKEKRRQDILEAGLDLFIRKGYAATKITDIANQVGMSTGLLFHYFESKEKLYETLIRLGVAGPQSVMPSQTAEPIVYFERVAAGILHAIRSDSFTAKMFVLMNHAMCSEATSSDIQELLMQTDTITPSIPLIEAGQNNKTIREGNPHALAIAYWSAIQGIAESVALKPEAACPEAEWIVDILRRKPE